MDEAGGSRGKGVLERVLSSVWKIGWRNGRETMVALAEGGEEEVGAD